VEDENGAKLEEASRFLGRPPGPESDPRESETLKNQRDELQAEVNRLRRQNEQQTERIQQLDRTLRILQARLGIADTVKQ
jgi:hypothetical protein